MPYHRTRELPEDGAGVELTPDDVTEVRIANIGTVKISLQATATGGNADFDEGQIELLPGAGFVKLVLADMFPGVANATRLHASCMGLYGLVSISYS